MQLAASDDIEKQSGRSGSQPHFPPTPPGSEDNDSERSAVVSSTQQQDEPDFPLPPPTTVPTQILDADAKTPDSWLPRDSRLIRLTGNHPFNVEPPLSALFDEGFLTSPELFYVRNHGPVPQVLDDEVLSWEFSVEGMVERPIKLTLGDLLEQYEQRTYPITLVCAGNRRKEQNMVRKSKGFSWGPAGVSTALFTGVMMSEIINAAKPIRGARFVCMEGADELPNGRYATSIKLNTVNNHNSGIMLAHLMNGEMLRPDHGKPLRVVIPGQIGGRSVKWLKRLILTAEPSDNWYHIYDNRVLPTMVSPTAAADDPSWWTDERYAIYDLSPNSAVAYPAHDERLALEDSTDLESTYQVRGYAYAGGGRRVTRVEVSLDKGRTWRLANIDYAEDKYRDSNPRQLYGGLMDMYDRETCFCWCFWDLEVSISELVAADDIVVRAMDEGMGIQPRDLYWNVMGMMNNPWFRVAITKENGCLQFEHPTQPALQPGGWMERVKQAGGDLTDGYWGEGNVDVAAGAVGEENTVEISMTNPDVKNTITIDELRKHEVAESPWFVVNDEVYDGTSFLKEHPGGAQSIEAAAAQDCTEEFMAIHSETARAMMKDYHIGLIDKDGKAALSSGEVEPNGSSNEPDAVYLQPRYWKKAILHSKSRVSWDTRVFTFKLDHDEQRLGLPIGQHILMKLRDPVTRETLIRSYTPISPTSKPGYVDVLVKVYFDTNERKGGKMSQAMDGLPTGHFIELKGPLGKFEYLGGGKCVSNGRERRVTTFILICGGTGVTPIYQVFRAIMQDASDATRCIVLDGNRLLEDILCKADLDEFAKSNSEKCELYYTLTQAADGWEGLQGRIAAPLLSKHAARKAHGDGEAMVLVCGPEGMEKSVHQALLDDGWSDDDLMFF